MNGSITELWAEKAKQILKSKRVNIEYISKRYHQIYFPWSNEYEKERLYFSLKIQQRPLIIIKALNINELEDILNYVKRMNLTIRICGGRHSTQLLSPEVLVDISLFSEIAIKGDNLIVGGGVRQGRANEFLFNEFQDENKRELYSHFGKYSYGRTSSFPGGSAQSVGVSGISTIGGVGVLRRTFGLTIDSIKSFKITLPPTSTSKSKTVYVNSPTNKNFARRTMKKGAENYNDLFWALCGGGGNNFGIISEITYSLEEVNEVIEYTITWPNLDFDNENHLPIIKNIIDTWVIKTHALENFYTEELDMYYNKGKCGIEMVGFFVVPINPQNRGTSRTLEIEAKRIVTAKMKYLTDIDTEIKGVITFKDTHKYSEMYREMVNNRVYHNFSIIQGIFTDDINADMYIKFIKNSITLKGSTVIAIEAMGGKIKEGTVGCFGFRNSKFFINTNSAWEDLEESESFEKYCNNTTKELLSTANGAYLGFPVAFEEMHPENKIYYGPTENNNYPRLQDIKIKYDPLNILTYSGTIKHPEVLNT